MTKLIKILPEKHPRESFALFRDSYSEYKRIDEDIYLFYDNYEKDPVKCKVYFDLQNIATRVELIFKDSIHLDMFKIYCIENYLEMNTNQFEDYCNKFKVELRENNLIAVIAFTSC